MQRMTEQQLFYKDKKIFGDLIFLQWATTTKNESRRSALNVSSRFVVTILLLLFLHVWTYYILLLFHISSLLVEYVDIRTEWNSKILDCWRTGLPLRTPMKRPIKFFETPPKPVYTVPYQFLESSLAFRKGSKKNHSCSLAIYISIMGGIHSSVTITISWLYVLV